MKRTRSIFPQGVSIKERIIAETYPEPNTGCWLWAGWVNNKSYGSICRGVNGKGKHFLVHRLSFEIHNNRKISEGMYVCHKCNVKVCVNPDHLYEGTNQQNVQQAHKDGLIGKKRGIMQLTMGGRIACTYKGLYDAENRTGFKKNDIRRACRSAVALHGFRWTFMNPSKPKKRKKSRYKKVHNKRKQPRLSPEKAKEILIRIRSKQIA